MTDNPIIELLDAIDAITKPVAVANWIPNKDGEKEIVRREDPPLLTQLKSAISSNIGSGGGAGRAARERTPLDVGAFQLYETIDGRVRAWMVDAGQGAQSRTEVGQVLRAWYVVWTAKNPYEQLVIAHTKIITGWAASIRDILDPPTKLEITDPCPICGQMWGTTGEGESEESTRALWAFLRPDETTSYGLCTACDKVWNGVAGLRRMRIAIDDAAALPEAAETA